MRGNQLLRSGKLEEAVNAFQKAIANYPNFHWSHYKLGETLEQLTRWEEAITSYRTAIQLNSNCVLYHYKLAKALLKSGDVEAGIKVFKERLKSYSDYKYDQYIADALSDKSEWEPASNHYNKAIEINPNSPPIQFRLSSVMKAAARDREKPGTLMESNHHKPNFEPDKKSAGLNLASHSIEDLEQKFAQQNGINFSLMQGKNFDPTSKFRVDPYKLLRFVEIDQLNVDHLIGDITALKIDKQHRFGNSIFQLSSAYHIAKTIGASRIYLSNWWYIKQGESKTPSGITIVNTSQPDFSSEKLVLEGTFFYSSTLGSLSATRPNLYLNMMDLMESVNLRRSGGEPLGDKDLVIHIRSGDIFSPQNPHPGYGQPPLSFYQKIITLQPWNSISLVFENKSNPIIEPLIDFAKEHCLQVRVISGSLREDIEYLLKSRVLVVSWGTFCSGIAVISKSLNTVYYFERLNPLHNTNISCIRIFDKQGVYQSQVLNNNWQNTKSQRQLMLSYPLSSLDLDIDKSKISKVIPIVNIDKNNHLRSPKMSANSISNMLSTILIMKPKPSPVPLIRIGGERDGAYLIPDDLDHIKACFSPGVANRKNFEDELTDIYGIQCHMCDKSSDIDKFQTPLKEGMQTFKKKWLDVNGETDSISLDAWVEELAPDQKDDLMLQMDIEGAEYRNILQTSEQVLKRFRIILVEVHSLGVARNPEQFEVNLGPFLRKLDQHFICVHAHPNNCCGDFMIPGTHINLPNVYELTFLRRDRFNEKNLSSWHEPMMPHPLDIKRNVNTKMPIFLSENSPTQVLRNQASTIKLLEDKLDYYTSKFPKEEDHKDGVIQIYKLAQSMANHLLLAEDINIDSKEIGDVAEGKHYYLSSGFGDFPKTGLVENKKPFFFHTGFGFNQYITIDLEKEHILTSLAIANRVDVCKERARCLFYAVHNSLKPDLSFGLPLNINESFGKGDDLECNTILKKAKGRYITIFSPENTALHFSAIKVFGICNDDTENTL
ncbi:MAG: protein arginine N-methyltransferase [Limnospira maxima]|nr:MULTISPECIES: protein arginine N-methyltransferase [unclassified Limnospira]MDT9259912.1 protein arginine N-methyltransferase [Limnospira sp. PMC 1236.20]MDT9290533.1 protein arginine N-methyltransferase [Limnospira sp. PMC 1295.21]